MIRISVQVGSGDFNVSTVIRAESIQRAVGLASMRYPGSEVKVLFPIDPEAFFEKESAPTQGLSRLEMLEELAG